MLTWAAADIVATDQDWVIAFWHHPPYTHGSHNSDTEGALVDMRENALPILEAGGVDLVLGGHSHIYERSFLLDGAYQTPSMASVGVLDASDGKADGDGPYRKSPGLSANEGAVYVVAGHGGTGVSGPANHPLMYFSEVQNGSCILDIQGNRLSLINIRHDGEITDKVAIIKGDGIIVTAPDGGERIDANTDFEITWTTVGDVANVRLEYSITDGAQWTTIEDSIPNTGAYTWTVPELDTGLGLVRVTDVSDEDTFDESNGVFRMSAHAPIVAVAFGDDWRYHDEGIDLGADWQKASYAVREWNEGPAQLGYGDGDEATTLIDAEPNYPSAYFRKSFELDGPAIDGELTVLFDDGAAVWINGTQVFGINVADGTDYASFASGSSDDNATATVNVAGAVFVAGENTIAAMVKQADGDSSDLSFDLGLVVSIASEPPDDGGDETGTGGGEEGGTATGGPNGATTSAVTTGDTTAGPLDSGGLSSTDTDTAGAAGPGGCGCRPASPPGLWLVLLLLPWLRRRS
jgi:MYXO-CTERM domain-containing protein